MFFLLFPYVKAQAEVVYFGAGLYSGKTKISGFKLKAQDGTETKFGAYRPDSFAALGLQAGFRLPALGPVSLRPEFEWQFRRGEKTEISGNAPGSSLTYYTSTLSFGSNLWVDWNISPYFSPYAGGGVGLALPIGHSSYRAPGESRDATSFDAAMLLRAGSGLRLKLKYIGFDAGFRYVYIDSYNIDYGQKNSRSKMHVSGTRTLEFGLAAQLMF